MEASGTTRPALPFNALLGLGLLLGGPLTAYVLVHALTPPTDCGRWGLDCAFRVLLGSLFGWIIGAVFAVRGLLRAEQRWFATLVLALNLLPLAAAAIAAVAIATRQ